MNRKLSQHLRRVLVSLHVLTSVGWWALSLVLLTLIAGAALGVEETRPAFLTSADFLDAKVLAPLAETAAYTGLMLSALTRWGYFRFWWVAVKFVLTAGAITLGVVLLGSWLDASLEAARHGGVAPTGKLVGGTLCVLVALIVSTWLSVAKPGGRLRRAAPAVRGREAEPQPHPALLAVVLALPLLDHFMLPWPMAQIVMALGYAVYRACRRQPKPQEPARVTVAAR
ncbi:hypothetical protein LX15_002479 [Streptoalloteichus tenebrarius]|uniref:Uncharacterized protein n=1 Tax=Streptoalloteichus tenebrarius (strain ATCC 17920 / DSM 40477 / JCM 4838 / CBS 697.72 / NBRC 16177 / NCIMB 11028 / NRRL B-12390 / A12253. 1 / ISP 5477) TaxID=1933 RepID=A0ABT1HTD5_STRSD|nr:hypothetical protein [Streptoalloteichus tenebrarius]MCP2258781.1 hypothetical protein [Streptoalloteichus tenebrarius]BFE99542.1 hypothetical protein GCM10020241_12180 [Streptoalloteichus tenebrarius]